MTKKTKKRKDGTEFYAFIYTEEVQAARYQPGMEDGWLIASGCGGHKFFDSLLDAINSYDPELYTRREYSLRQSICPYFLHEKGTKPERYDEEDSFGDEEWNLSYMHPHAIETGTYIVVRGNSQKLMGEKEFCRKYVRKAEEND